MSENNNRAEPGSIDELFEISDLIQEKAGKGELSLPISLSIAAKVRANDIAQVQAELFEEAVENFVQVCMHVMAAITKFSENSEKKVPTIGKRR